ncbi:MAG: hypothetical protein ACREC0_11140 [Methylocella sp.]
MTAQIPKTYRSRLLKPRLSACTTASARSYPALARAQWKELKERGFAATYWQQGANGRWDMKA